MPDAGVLEFVTCRTQPGVRLNNESTNGHHAETTDHDNCPGYLEIIDRNVNKNAFFLEALHSIEDHNSINELIHFPLVCLLMAASLGTGGK